MLLDCSANTCLLGVGHVELELVIIFDSLVYEETPG